MKKPLSSSRIDEIEIQDQRLARKWIYVVLVLYLFSVVFFSISLGILLWLRALNKIDIPFDTLKGFMIGTGGLGAGSLIFLRPLRYLFPKA